MIKKFIHAVWVLNIHNRKNLYNWDLFFRSVTIFLSYPARKV